MDDLDRNGEDIGFEPAKRTLPADLPTSLDDRRNFPSFNEETEYYDAWQGQSRFLTNPIPARPLHFKLALDDHDLESDFTARRLEDNDSRMAEMLAHQAKVKEDTSDGQEDAVAEDDSLSDAEKRDILQSALAMAASNGDIARIERLLNGKARAYVDVNKPDAEGTVPLIYASCFGHQDAVSMLLDAGAEVDKQDKNNWTALMWALTNRHKNIAKILLDHGASPEVKSSTGRTAFDFVAPGSEISEYLHESGYNIGNAGVTDDFYNAGFSQDRFEEEMAENEMKRRMAMESAFNLEVDLGNLGLDEQPESPTDLEEGQEFVWDRCLNDQMFVFQENELNRILDTIITNMTPQRSPSQKPVPANILFLSARYAHYHATPELLETLMLDAMDKINSVVEKHQWDMTVLSFWISNATLLLHYLKKDPGLMAATSQFQQDLAELINEIFVLILRDAERRMDKFLDAAILDHETIPGFEDLEFQGEWRIFRSKPKAKAPEPPEKRFRPPSPKRRAQTSPRNITSLLSSTLFVLDLYDIHSVIIAQILSQLFYWLGAEVFNRIMSNRKYLARTKAMNIRMNISALEDWARTNNRQPQHYEHGSTVPVGEPSVESARRHLEPAVQLLQWLQCFSSLSGEDLANTIKQLPRLNPEQLLHAVKYYRAEVGEKTLAKPDMKYLQGLQKEAKDRRNRPRKAPPSPGPGKENPLEPTTPSTPVKQLAKAPQLATPSPAPSKHSDISDDEEPPEDTLLLDPAIMLPFHLPTSTDMLVSYGAGFGGLDRERERKYIPTVPPEFLAKLDLNGGRGSSIYENARFSESL